MLIKSPFARNLSLKIAIASSVLLFSVLMTVASFEVSIAVRNCASKMDKQMELCAENIDAEFEDIKDHVDNMALMIDYVPTDSLSYRETLTGLLKSDPAIFDIYVYLNPRSALKTGLVCPIVERSEKDDSITFKAAMLPKWSKASITEMFKVGIETVNYSPWYGPFFEPLPCIYILGYAAASPAVKDGAGCVVGMDVSVDDLVESLKSMELYPGSETYVVDDKNHLICDSKHAMPSVGKHLDKATLDGYALNYLENIRYQEFDIRADEDPSTYDLKLGNDGTILDKSDFLRYLFSKSNIRIVREYKLINGWLMYVTCPLKEVFADVRKTLSLMGLGIIISIILLFVFCTRIIVRKVRPLKLFASATHHIAKGNFDAELPVIGSKDEIGQLRDSFDAMQVSLKQYIRDLKKTTAEKQQMESELNIASGIQSQALRKDFPSSGRFDLYAAMHAAKEVGGDLYDFVLKGDKLYICIGDVSGKGVPAALLMMTATTLFRQVCTTSDRTLSEMCSLINNCIADGNDSFFFVTFFSACIHLDTLEMEYCNCGHNQILITGPDGKASFNEAIPNKPFGIVENFRYTSETIRLEKGSRVILYTDGVNEAKNNSKEQYGNGRLLEWAGTVFAHNNEKSVVDNLYGSIDAFVGDAEQSDDITVLSVRIK